MLKDDEIQLGVKVMQEAQEIALELFGQSSIMYA